jgi:hypothetical protein
MIFAVVSLQVETTPCLQKELEILRIQEIYKAPPHPDYLLRLSPSHISAYILRRQGNAHRLDVEDFFRCNASLSVLSNYHPRQVVTTFPPSIYIHDTTQYPIGHQTKITNLSTSFSWRTLSISSCLSPHAPDFNIRVLQPWRNWTLWLDHP